MTSQLVFSHRVLRPRDVAAVTTLVGESGVSGLNVTSAVRLVPEVLGTGGTGPSSGNLDHVLHHNCAGT